MGQVGGSQTHTRATGQAGSVPVQEWFQWTSKPCPDGHSFDIWQMGKWWGSGGEADGEMRVGGGQMTPSVSRFKRGRLLEGKEPLRLAFRAREGVGSCWKEEGPLCLTFRVREGDRGNLEGKEPPPSCMNCKTEVSLWWVAAYYSPGIHIPSAGTD